MRNLLKLEHILRGPLTAALALALLLTGCGGSGDPPTDYPVAEETVPALNRLVGLPADTTFTEAADDSGAVTYQYDGLTSGGETAEEYVSMLGEVSGGKVVDEQGVETAPPDFSADQGTACVGIDSADGSGMLLVELQWTDAGCAVTPTYQAGLTVTAPQPEADAQEEPAEAITVEEAVATLRAAPAETLGLDGDMSAYCVYAQEGFVMVDDVPCYCLNVYYADDHQIAGTYLLSDDGARLYRLDRETDQVTELRR